MFLHCTSIFIFVFEIFIEVLQLLTVIDIVCVKRISIIKQIVTPQILSYNNSYQ